MPHESERFKEIKVLGQGQFGQTLLVEDRADGNRLVAIKVPIDKSTELTLINEVINNAILYNSMKEIDHPNLVKYLGIDKYKDLYVMIMEYVDGKDLSSVMGHFRNRLPLEVDLALRIAVNVCSGLALPTTPVCSIATLNRPLSSFGIKMASPSYVISASRASCGLLPRRSLLEPGSIRRRSCWTEKLRFRRISGLSPLSCMRWLPVSFRLRGPAISIHSKPR